MHAEAYEFVAGAVEQFGPFDTVVEIGSREINGAVRHLFDGAGYVGVDPIDGGGVDVVADAASWRPEEQVACVVCCGVLEHVEHPETLVDAAGDMLRPGGVFILSTVCDPHPPHSMFDGGLVRANEHYANIDPDLLHGWLDGWTVELFQVHGRGDLFAIARVQ